MVSTGLRPNGYLCVFQCNIDGIHDEPRREKGRIGIKYVTPVIECCADNKPLNTPIPTVNAVIVEILLCVYRALAP